MSTTRQEKKQSTSSHEFPLCNAMQCNALCQNSEDCQRKKNKENNSNPKPYGV